MQCKQAHDTQTERCIQSFFVHFESFQSVSIEKKKCQKHGEIWLVSEVANSPTSRTEQNEQVPFCTFNLAISPPPETLFEAMTAFLSTSFAFSCILLFL